jgi:ABC-2 type transport system permease protein
VLAHEVGPLEFLAPAARSIDIRVHSLCNPEAITSYNIVPGRMGVVLTMTLVMVTALAIAREYERGPMENLDWNPKRSIAFAISKLETETEHDGHRFAERLKDYTCPKRA